MHTGCLPNIFVFCFVEILPDDIKHETIGRKDLVHVNLMVAFAQEEVSRLNGRRIANLHEKRRREVLGSKHEAYTTAVTHDSTKDPINEIKQMLAAAISSASSPSRGSEARKTGSGRSSPRSPSPGGSL